jgi:hypothetical protein
MSTQRWTALGRPGTGLGLSGCSWRASGTCIALSGDLPPPPQALSRLAESPLENSDAATDRSMPSLQPGRHPCPPLGPIRGRPSAVQVLFFFFIVTSIGSMTPEQTYTSGRTPPARCIVPLRCLLSCSPCDSASKTADCRPLAPYPSLARPSSLPALESSTPLSAYPRLLLPPDFSRLQPRNTTTGVAAETRTQLTRAIISPRLFSPSSRDSLFSAFNPHYMSPQSLLYPSISRGSREHDPQG